MSPEVEVLYYLFPTSLNYRPGQCTPIFVYLICKILGSVCFFYRFYRLILNNIFVLFTRYKLITMQNSAVYPRLQNFRHFSGNFCGPTTNKILRYLQKSCD